MNLHRVFEHTCNINEACSKCLVSMHHIVSRGEGPMRNLCFPTRYDLLSQSVRPYTEGLLCVSSLG